MKIGLKLMLNALLAAFILIPAITLLVVGAVSIFSFSENLVKEELSTISYSQAGMVSVLFSEYKSDISNASKLGFVANTAEGKYVNEKELVDDYINTFVEKSPYVKDFIITDMNGVVCSDFIGRDIGSLFFGFNEEIRELTEADVFVSDIVVLSSEYNNSSIFYLTKKITRSDNGVGYVSVVLSTDALYDFIKNTDFFDNNADFFITDSKGTAIGYGETPVTRNLDMPTNLRESISSVAGIRKNSTAKYESLSINSNVGFYQNIGDSIWSWFCIYPTTHITKLVSGHYVTGLVIVGIISAIFIVITLIITNIVIKPMKEMTAKMKLINSGERDERFEITGTNEFARMASSFNDMLDDVIISEELHRTISEISDNILFEWDFSKEVMFVSENFKTMFDVNYNEATLLNGKFIDTIMSDSDAEKYKRDIRKLLKTKESFYGEYEVSTRSSGTIWISVRSQCVTDRLGELLRVIGVITNIDNEKKLALRLSERASFDFLSTLYNRNTFEREFVAEIKRNASRNVGVIFIDIDDFKMINDSYGHTVGDEVIKHAAMVIKEELKGNGFAGRFGGDEFIICVNEPNTVQNIEGLAAKLIEQFSKGYTSKTSPDVHINIRASLGIAVSPRHGKDSETLIAHADEAMYFVKKNGKMNFHVYDPNDSEDIGVMRTM